MEIRKTLLLATLTLSGALLVGCGDDEPAPEESTQSSQQSTQTQQESVPDEGNATSQSNEQTMPENPAADNEPNRDAPNPPDVESGTNINTGTGNDNMPEPANEATDETTQNQQSGQ
jgi:PBP1b-binding outer membrane lipoprotein LpoB